MSHTAFAGQRRIGTGTPAALAEEIRARLDLGELVLVFEDQTGSQVDLDLRGTVEEIARRYSAGTDEAAPRTGPGRPRLGVVSREVSLLPRHWEWLARQPGGASAMLRRLVDAARREGAGDEGARQARDAAHRFMLAMAGDYPGFEEAARALFADDFTRLDEIIQPWPVDVRDHLRLMLLPAARGAE